ncbi:Na+/H+ antiporter NhaC family protein, partial [Clostridium botulinum]|nr:Na+/H+ antiporter NhaC family protein [Clostridium botulinum]
MKTKKTIVDMYDEYIVVIGIIFAFILIQGSLDEKMDSFVKGCGDENIIIMCIIYLLA